MRASSRRPSILVVDDAPDTREVLERNLSADGYTVYTAPGVDEAIRFLHGTPVDLVITDLRMPRVSGLDLVRHVRENSADMEVMMITGYPSVGGAVEAMKSGADNYLPKPFTDEELRAAVRQALEKLRRRRAGRAARSAEPPRPYGLVGQSAPLQAVFRAISRAAATSATVLITGESGTGKELVARAIHYSSPRSAAPFVPVNCGSIPESLLESELFGHVKGAYTGATETRAGFFQTADGGTIFLDEVSETSLAMQVKLLRVLEDGHVAMVGSDRAREVDVRVVASSNKDLGGLVRAGRFREDLFYRVNVLTIELPPLRNRGEDILLLLHHFAHKFCEEMGRPTVCFTDRALSILTHEYPWPGNVRELENVVQRLVVMGDGNVIDAPDLPPPMRFAIPFRPDPTRSLADVETEHIRSVLANVHGNKTRAAAILGIDRKTLRQKLTPGEPATEA